MTSDGIKPFNYKYEETEPYEKGFASHYLRNVVPAILEVREKQARTVKLARRGRNLAIGVALLLALAFGAIDVETVERLPGHVGILVIGSFLVVGGLFEAFANLPGRQFRDRLKTRVIPQIISFFGPYQYAYTKWADSWLDRFEGEYEGRFFRFAEIEETSSMNDDGHRSVIFDGVTLHVAIPRVPCTTRIHQDRGRYDDPRKETGKGIDGMQWVPLDDPELEAEFEVFGIDVTVARALAGRELLGITDTFARLLDATRTELGFSGKTFYLKIETGKDFFEPGRIDADAFGPAAVKRIVGEVHTLLEVVEAAIRIADAAAQKAPDLFPEGFTEHIVENDDGTFSVHGRTYTSRATAEAYLEHYG